MMSDHQFAIARGVDVDCHDLAALAGRGDSKQGALGRAGRLRENVQK
jgi:hypothetical protein